MLKARMLEREAKKSEILHAYTSAQGLIPQLANNMVKYSMLQSDGNRGSYQEVSIDRIEIVDIDRNIIRVCNNIQAAPALVRTMSEDMPIIIQKKAAQIYIKEFQSFITFINNKNGASRVECFIDIVDPKKGLIKVHEIINSYEVDHIIQLHPSLIEKIIESKVRFFPSMTIDKCSGKVTLNIPNMNEGHIMDKNEEVEFKEAPETQIVSDEIIQEKGKTLVTFIEKIKAKVSKIFDSIKELEQDYNLFIKDFTNEEATEGQASSVEHSDITPTSTETEVIGDPALSVFSTPF